MSSYLPSFFEYLFVLIAVYAISYLVGRLLLTVMPGVYKRNDDSFNVYVSTVLGAIISVSVFAIIWTGGRSIMWIVVMLFAIYIFDKKHHDSVADKEKFRLSELKCFLLFLFVLVFLYSVAYYFLVVRIRLISPYGDPLYYSNLSYRLIDNGVETASLINGQPTPYHYFEEWLNGIVASAFHLNFYASLFLITYTFLLSLSIMGAYNICSSFISKKWLSLCFGISFLIFAPLSANVLLYLNNFILGKTFLYSYPAVTLFKLSTVFAVMVCSLTLWMKRNEDMAVCLLLCLVSLYSPVSAAVLIFVFMYSILIWKPFWKNKFFIINKYSLYCLIVGSFFGLFYILTKTNMSFNSGNAQGVESASSVGVLSETIKLFVYELMLIIPSVLVLMVCKYKKEKTLGIGELKWFSIVVIVSLLMIDIVASVYSQVNIDGGQMANNFAVPLICIIPFVVYLYISKKYSKIIGYSLILVPVLMFVIFPQRGSLWQVLCGHHDDEFYEDAGEFLDSIKESNDGDTYIFGSFCNYETCNIDGMRWTISYPLSGYLHLLLPDGYYFPKCLSVLDIPEDIDAKFNEKKSSELYKYIENQKKCGNYSNDGSSICDYAVDNKINYIVVVKGAKVPTEISQRLQFVAEYDGCEVYKFIYKELEDI